jgi:hypothetical protein
MQDPMWLLYVLVVPRGEAEAGRYQTRDPQSRKQVRRFLREFGNSLETDGRHKLCIRSVNDGSMLVYDQHNLVYAYGHTEEWKLLLRQSGMREVEPKSINVPYRIITTHVSTRKNRGCSTISHGGTVPCMNKMNDKRSQNCIA